MLGEIKPLGRPENVGLRGLALNWRIDYGFHRIPLPGSVTVAQQVLVLFV